MSQHSTGPVHQSRRWPMIAISSIVTAVVVLGALLVLAGCSTKQVRSYYADDYLQALQQWRGTDDAAILETGVERFENTLGDFTQADLRDKVEQLYAQELYFNDTFKTFSSLDELAPYLEETGEMVDASSVEILGHAIKGEDLYVRWKMDLEFSAGGKDIQSRSLGMTHLRMNADGKIILHQDFWDSTDGFFSHLPIVGGLLHRVHKKL